MSRLLNGGSIVFVNGDWRLAKTRRRIECNTKAGLILISAGELNELNPIRAPNSISGFRLSAAPCESAT